MLFWFVAMKIWAYHVLFISGSSLSRNFWTHLIIQSNLRGCKLFCSVVKPAQFYESSWTEQWGDLPDASVEGRATLWAQPSLETKESQGRLAWQTPWSWETCGDSTLFLQRLEGIDLWNQTSVEDPGCLISLVSVLEFAVPIKLPGIYVCVLFVFCCRNPSIQQRG